MITVSPSARRRLQGFDHQVSMILGEGWDALEQVTLVGPVNPIRYGWVPRYWAHLSHTCAWTGSHCGDSVIHSNVPVGPAMAVRTAPTILSP